MVKKRIYGLMAEFVSPEEVLAAAHRTHDAGYRRIDAFSPIPVEGLAEAVGFDWTILPTLVFFGGLGGGLTGFGMCWYANVISFPLNIGGKPFNSWPMWIPITFELTVLFAAVGMTLTFCYLCQMAPFVRKHHRKVTDKLCQLYLSLPSVLFFPELSWYKLN